MIRVLVTGSREWDDWPSLTYALIETAGTDPDVTIVHGANRKGADAMADEVAEARGWRTEPHHAEWTAPCRTECKPGHRKKRKDGTEYCPAAGNYRNQEMVDIGADVCLAFYQLGAVNRGTGDCAARAKKAGITVIPVINDKAASGFGPAWARYTGCCAKPVGCTNMSEQCLLRNHSWKRRHA